MGTDLRALARDTMEILHAGRYGKVDLTAPVDAAVAGTRLVTPGEPLPRPAATGPAPIITVTDESTLAATRRLARDGEVAALVFASAKHPGGGFRNGARAQEESLARASALFPCLNAVPQFYAYHRARTGNLYSDHVIHAPSVPVFRDDSGALLPMWYPVSFLTAAAPNRGAVPAARAAQVATLLAARARRVLAVAAAHGHRRLVLGAWGCGVFRNDPATVADAFATALAATPGWFDEVVFAILGAAERPPFEARLLRYV